MGLLKTLTINGTKYEVVPVVPASSVTLKANAWSGDGERYSQVVGIPGVTSCTKVDLQPTSEQLAEFHYKVLAFVAENEGGLVTVYAIGDRPSEDHTIQVTLTEVAASEKIRGNTVGTSMPRSNVEQTDPNQADYIEGVEKLVKSINGIKPDASGNVGGSIVCTESGSMIMINDASDHLVQGMRIFGKTTQATAPTPTSPADLINIGAGQSVSVLFGSLGQATIGLQDGLPGIPMQTACTKHNYTDNNGQKWFTDEIDLGRGVYIQRCFTLVFDGTEPWYISTSGGLLMLASSDYVILGKFDIGTYAPDNGDCAYHMCSHFLSVPRNGTRNDGTVSSYGTGRGYTLQFNDSRYNGNLEGWKGWLAEQAAAGTPMTMVLGLTKPVETELSDEVKEEFARMHTNKGNMVIQTTIGAEMEVSYVADTKLYIDNKFNALATALVNNT